MEKGSPMANLTKKYTQAANEITLKGVCVIYGGSWLPKNHHSWSALVNAIVREGRLSKKNPLCFTGALNTFNNRTSPSVKALAMTCPSYATKFGIATVSKTFGIRKPGSSEKTVRNMIFGVCEQFGYFRRKPKTYRFPCYNREIPDAKTIRYVTDSHLCDILK